MKTENADGHLYIPQAVAKGASVIVAEKEWKESVDSLEKETCYLIVDDTLRALQGMASLHRQQFKIPVVAITGSNGKTTTKEMLALILEEDMTILKNPGNFNNHLGVPLTLLQLAESHELAIVEMGTNHPGEIKKLCQIADPTAGTVTNIGHAHVGNFSSHDVLVGEKKSLLDFINNKKGMIILNTFDPILKEMKYNGDVLTIGSSEGNDLVSTSIDLLPDKIGISFDINNSVTVALPVPGYHNRMNAMLAIALAMKSGMTIEKAAARLSTFRSSTQRMEILSVDGITILNDCYNASPESMSEAIIYGQELAHSRNRPLLMVLGDMLELGNKSDEFHRQIRENLSEEKIYSLWLAGKYMLSLAREIEDNRLDGGLHYAEEPDLWQEELLEKIPANAVILVKASRGMHLEKVVSAILSRLNSGAGASRLHKAKSSDFNISSVQG